MDKVICEHMHLLTLGQLAVRVGIGEGRLRRLFTNGTLPEPIRLMGKRVFTEADVETIRAALLEHGLLPKQRGAEHGQATEI
jgi:predicted DNA-binding transcriptional regulator AlpA